MRIVQMLPTISYGDAIGNHVVALHRLLRANGYETDIYARNIDPRVKEVKVKTADEYKDNADVILYHLSTGDELNERVKRFRAKKIFNYHNITPDSFFKGYDEVSRELCRNGLKQARSLYSAPDLCICDSAFNRDDLISFGYTCPMEVIPILIAFDDYKKEKSKEVLEKYSDDGYINIMFAGRVAPNKKQEDLISAFYYYHNYINQKSRLFIVGAYDENNLYFRKLKKYVEELNLDDVIFTGHIKFNEILAYYGVADVFLCMSEHEGFCVPLVEAMYFNVPIIAYDSTAVGETLGGAGLLLGDKDPRKVAEAIDIVINRQELRNTILSNQRIRLQDFSNDRIEKQFLNCLKNS